MLAHVRKDEKGKWHEHFLEEHLCGVAEMAGEFAKKFSNEDWAIAASLLHDIGKGSNAFQNKIKSKSGYDPEAHIKDGEEKAPHSTHGADWAYRNWPEKGKVLAYLIAGHHGGLPDWYHEIGVGSSLGYRLDTKEIAKLPYLSKEFASKTLENLKAPSSTPAIQNDKILHLWIRMLYSCLVDADFLDTERFMDEEKFNRRGKHSSIEELKEIFNTHMESLVKDAPQTPVNVIRASILSECRKQAGKKPGLFSLTVPTGGGKTLSSMAFALEHAKRYNKERIIMVIPFTSIIEQTANIYKTIFGEENVIEHHSSLDPEKETFQNRLATENWDAPIIVTTSVQFFESLFAAKSSACRKLHNIVNSIVVIDEVQMLPTDFLKPILHAINGLTQSFGVSMVLCSATQPAITSKIFKKRDDTYYAIIEDEKCREIMKVPSPEELTDSLQRVEVRQVGKFSEWSLLADELKKHKQVLCIVNTRNDCRDLFNLMPKTTLHLSANMCGEHRSDCIEKIKTALKKEEPIRVVSTQLVEAGVDIDFPIVFRAMAGFDSIAQAAGRCNREGNLNNRGQVFVFEPPKPAPVGTLRKGESAGRSILTTDPEGCKNLLPETFRRYFESYFADLNSFDKQDMESLLVTNANPDLNFQFRSAARRFNMIENKRQLSVVVLYKRKRKEIEKMVNDLRYAGPNRELMRKLQRFIVSIPENIFFEVKDSFEDINGIWCQMADTLYDNDLGFVGYNSDLPIIY